MEDDNLEWLIHQKPLRKRRRAVQQSQPLERVWTHHIPQAAREVFSVLPFAFGGPVSSGGSYNSKNQQHSEYEGITVDHQQGNYKLIIFFTVQRWTGALTSWVLKVKGDCHSSAVQLLLLYIHHNTLLDFTTKAKTTSQSMSEMCFAEIKMPETNLRQMKMKMMTTWCMWTYGLNSWWIILRKPYCSNLHHKVRSISESTFWNLWDILCQPVLLNTHDMR